jgi:hypothetical protein
MSRPILCDWCQCSLADEHELVKVRFNNDNPLDCCPRCAKGLAPKPKVGRPRGKKTPATAIAQAEIVRPEST